MRYPEVKPKSVVVTGCSTGIGLATAEVLRSAGWKVLPTARKDEDLAMLQERGFEPVRLDLADSASVQAAADDVLRRLDGRLGAVVNNAGYGQPGAMEDLSRDTMRRQFEVNVFGMQELTNRFIPVFRRQKGGRIVNVSSVVGYLSLPFLGIYSASKFAMEAISDALRVELRSDGIAVVLVEPGPIATCFGANARREGTGSLLTKSESLFHEAYKQQLAEDAASDESTEFFRKPPEAVAAKILRALTVARPAPRYKVTALAHIGGVLACIAPTALIDRMMFARWSSDARAGAKGA